MPLRYISIQADALHGVQCTRHIPALYDGHFSDMVEKTIEVFMDEFSVLGGSFDNCLENLRLVLIRCEETNLVLNWEKCHFMVQEGIVLGHQISARGIEVDKAKIEAI